jgi:hypothetical protein
MGTHPQGPDGRAQRGVDRLERADPGEELRDPGFRRHQAAEHGGELVVFAARPLQQLRRHVRVHQARVRADRRVGFGHRGLERGADLLDRHRHRLEGVRGPDDPRLEFFGCHSGDVAGDLPHLLGRLVQRAADRVELPLRRFPDFPEVFVLFPRSRSVFLRRAAVEQQLIAFLQLFQCRLRRADRLHQLVGDDRHRPAPFGGSGAGRHRVLDVDVVELFDDPDVGVVAPPGDELALA